MKKYRNGLALNNDESPRTMPGRSNSKKGVKMKKHFGKKHEAPKMSDFSKMNKGGATSYKAAKKYQSPGPKIMNQSPRN